MLLTLAQQGSMAGILGALWDQRFAGNAQENITVVNGPITVIQSSHVGLLLRRTYSTDAGCTILLTLWPLEWDLNIFLSFFSLKMYSVNSSKSSTLERPNNNLVTSASLPLIHTDISILVIIGDIIGLDYEVICLTQHCSKNKSPLITH